MVHRLAKYTLSVNSLDERHRNHTFSEAFELGCTFAFLQFLLLDFSVIVVSYCDSELKIKLINLVFYNVHFYDMFFIFFRFPV